MSINRGVDKEVWYIYTIEYYLAIKKNEIMPFKVTWMDLESVILSEVRQTEMIGHNFNVAIAFLLSFGFCQSCLFTRLRKETHTLNSCLYSFTECNTKEVWNQYLKLMVAQLAKNLPAVQETWFRSLGWKDPLEKETLPIPVFWPGEFHGLYSPRVLKESDTTEWLSQWVVKLVLIYALRGDHPKLSRVQIMK